MKTALATAAAIIACGIAAQAGAANLLVNGGFEAGPALNFGTYYRGPLTPTGWDRVAGLEAPDILDDAYNQTGAGFAQLLDPHGGSRFLDMNGASATGGLAQTVSGLTPLSAVTVTYWVGRWAQNSAGVLTASLFGSVTTSETTTLDYLPGASLSAWVQHTLTGFASNTGTVTLRFTGNSSSTARGAPGLDDVVLTQDVAAVPEPAAWALMIGGFGLAGGALRRRRAQTAL